MVTQQQQQQEEEIDDVFPVHPGAGTFKRRKTPETMTSSVHIICSA